MAPTDTSFRLFNTLSGNVEPVELIEPGVLRFYSCGPTVYSTAHIGNFRSFLTADLILRTAQAIGWEVRYVTNITDVGHLTEDDVADSGGEDRMAKALESEGKRFANVYDLARHYTQLLLTDWKRLNLREPTVRPRATEHIMQQIQAVEELVDRGAAYETDKGIYFAVDQFPTYGVLSGNVAADTLEQGVRDVVQDEGKRDPRDFALWKKDPGHLMQWFSPWGWGFPGWHIECSVMSMTYLGDEMDIHAGGEDLIFPHHECEIAQAESLSGKRFARHWVHTRFLQVEGQKMSKSKGNYFTVEDLVAPESEGGRAIDPIALRLALISGQYRKPYNFTFDTLKASIKHVERLRSAKSIAESAVKTGNQDGPDRIGERLDTLSDRMLDALLDDLNTPEAIAAAIEGAKLIQGLGDGLNAASARSALRFIDTTNDLLGIVYPETPPGEDMPGTADPMADKVEELLSRREQARKARDFELADVIRAEIEAMGVEVMNSPSGTTWRRKRRSRRARANKSRPAPPAIPVLEIHGIDGGFVRMVNRFLEEGTLTGEADSDEFLRSHAEAVLLGLLYDQRVRAEYAFTGPERLYERLGHLDMNRIARMDLDDLREVFAVSPAVHRFTNKMAEYTLELARAVVDEYDGRPESIWSDDVPAKTVEKRIAALPGFGKGKAAKAKYVLHYFGQRDFTTT